MPAFGLDIGSTSIKVVQLGKQGDSFTLLAAGITPTPANGLGTENQQDLETVAQAVKKLVVDTKITTREVSLSLPESKVYTRLINLPLLTDEEVSSAIAWQAEPYIPIPVAEASLEHQVVGRTQPQGGNPGRTDVLLIAAPKILIKKYLDVAGMVGLTPVSVVSESIALTSVSLSEQTVLLADIGAVSCDFAIVRSGQLVVSRSIATGGNVLTRAVSAGLSVDTQRAEEYKKSYGLNADYLEGRVKAAIEPAFKVIVEEARKTIQYYHSEVSKDDQVSSVILSGGTAGIPDGTSYLASALGIEALVGDPFSQIVKSEQTAKSLAAWSPLYSIAVGLAKYAYT